MKFAKESINLFLLAWVLGCFLQMLVLGIDIYSGTGALTYNGYVRFWVEHTALESFATMGNVLLGLLVILASMCLYSTVLAALVSLIDAATKPLRNKRG
ncbi:MAG: hypothetical protein ACOX9C_09220 [Kiritimatiellia bacterium]